MALICQCGKVVDVDRLLALANGALLHKALVAQGVGVSYRNVARWVGEGRKQPPADLEGPILAAFGLDTRKDALPSEWEGRFEKMWGLLVATAIASGVELEQVEEMQRELDASLRSPLPDAQRQTEDAHSRDV